MAPVIDCHNHAGVELLAYLRGDFPYAQMLPQMVGEGRAAAGVTHWIVFPMVSNLSLDIAGMREGLIRTDNALETVPYAWENRRLLDELHTQYPQYLPHVFPFAMFDPMRNPHAQANALRALRAEYPFYGLKTQTTILQSFVSALRGEGRVLLELANEWNLPVLIHSSVHPQDPWAQASDILDIVEQTPGVRFCVAHSCRFDQTQLERVTRLPNAWFDCSAHIIHCELACRNGLAVAPPARRFASDYARPDQVLRDLAQAYPGKLVWGSDSPYYSFAPKNGGGLWSSYADEGACLHALPPPLVREIAFANPQTCFGLPLAEETT